MNDKILGLLGLARRAGRLQIGFEASAEAVEKGKSKLLILASDTAQRTEKELRFLSRDKEIDIIRIENTKAELSKAVGTSVGALAVCDENFAERVKELCVQGGNNI